MGPGLSEEWNSGSRQGSGGGFGEAQDKRDVAMSSQNSSFDCDIFRNDHHASVDSQNRPVVDA